MAKLNCSDAAEPVPPSPVFEGTFPPWHSVKLPFFHANARPSGPASVRFTNTPLSSQLGGTSVADAPPSPLPPGLPEEAESPHAVASSARQPQAA